jgi:hypothetical protein
MASGTYDSLSLGPLYALWPLVVRSDRALWEYHDPDRLARLDCQSAESLEMKRQRSLIERPRPTTAVKPASGQLI